MARIELARLPRTLPRGGASRQARAEPAPSAEGRHRVRSFLSICARRSERALLRADGNITHAALALGLTRHGLKKRMLRLGLRSPQKLGRSMKRAALHVCASFAALAGSLASCHSELAQPAGGAAGIAGARQSEAGTGSAADIRLPRGRCQPGG